MSKPGTIAAPAAVVDATTPATTALPPMYFVVQRTASGSRGVVRSIPSGDGCSPTDFGALFVLYRLVQQGAFGNMPYDTWLHSLSYLLDLNTLQIRFAQPVIAPEVFPSDQERLELLAASQHAVASRTNSIPQCFFSRSNRYQGYEVGCLLDAAFNADFAIVKALLENSRHPEILLSIRGEVVVDGYPDITRRGTALQLALRSGDTEMVELMATYLPHAKFRHQFESVFGTDFVAFESKQKEDAVELFKGLEDAFNRASYYESNDVLNHVPGTTSALHTKLMAFKSAIEKYIVENPTHNNFIFAKAHEIYDKNWRSWSSKLLLFSQQIIGLVQASAKKTSSFCLQDYAQGIYYRGEKNEASSRSYNLRRTSVDIRSLVNLGSSACIDILGRQEQVEGRVPAHKHLSSWENYVEQKQEALRTLCGVGEHLRDRFKR